MRELSKLKLGVGSRVMKEARHQLLIWYLCSTPFLSGIVIGLVPRSDPNQGAGFVKAPDPPPGLLQLPSSLLTITEPNTRQF